MNIFRWVLTCADAISLSLAITETSNTLPKPNRVTHRDVAYADFYVPLGYAGAKISIIDL